MATQLRLTVCWQLFRLALMHLGVVAFLGLDVSAAFAQEAVLAKSVFTEPSQITKQVLSGLFTSVARAGNRLVAAGQDGRIVVSDDNGKSWHQVQTPTSVTLTNIRFVSPAEGWAVGQMGIVLHTIDGGTHWAIQFDGLRANKTLLTAAEADATAQPKAPASQTDLQNAQQFVAGGPSLPFFALFPLSAKSIIVAGGFGMAFVSNDGGASWQANFDSVPNPNGLHIYTIIADGDSQLWAGEEGLALLRDPQGDFKVLTTPFQGSFFGALRGADGTLFLYGLQGTILRSADDGSSWQQIANASSGGVDCGIVLQNGALLLGDLDGSLLLSQDNGKTFSVAKAAGPVTGLAQAADGSVITAGPQGLHVVTLPSLLIGS